MNQQTTLYTFMFVPVDTKCEDVSDSGCGSTLLQPDIADEEFLNYFTVIPRVSPPTHGYTLLRKRRLCFGIVRDVTLYCLDEQELIAVVCYTSFLVFLVIIMLHQVE